MTPNVKRHVDRLLAAERQVDGETVRAFPAFRLFVAEDPPSWWRPHAVKPEWGQVLGIYENVTSSGTSAVVVTSEGLVVFDEEANEKSMIPYREIARWDPLSKEPVSASLVLWTHDGGRVEVPLRAREGDAFSFVQFLISAVREHRR
jgi:hypothetical protein